MHVYVISHFIINGDNFATSVDTCLRVNCVY